MHAVSTTSHVKLHVCDVAAQMRGVGNAHGPGGQVGPVVLACCPRTPMGRSWQPRADGVKRTRAGSRHVVACHGLPSPLFRHVHRAARHPLGRDPRMDCGESWSRGECKNAVSQAAHGHAANRHGASVAQAVASLAQVGRQYGSIAQVPGPHPGCRYATMPAVLPVHEETPKCKVGVSMSRLGSAPFSRMNEALRAGAPRRLLPIPTYPLPIMGVFA